MDKIVVPPGYRLRACELFAFMFGENTIGDEINGWLDNNPDVEVVSIQYSRPHEESPTALILYLEPLPKTEHGRE